MKTRTILRFPAVIGALAFLLTASMIATQSGQASFIVSTNGSKESGKVKIKLVRESGKIIRVTQFVGKWITVKFNGQSFGFVPKVDDQTGAVSLVLHSIDGQVGDNIRPAKELETIGVSKTLPARSSSVDLPFSIMIDEGSKVSADPIRSTVGPSILSPGLQSSLTAASTETPLGRPPDVTLEAPKGVFKGRVGVSCCVTCDGLQTCGCAVGADCGTCCAPECC